MNNKLMVAFLFFAILIILSIFWYVKINDVTNKSCESLKEKEKDDCFHSLAHELNDKNICYSIVETEAKENCILHVVG